MHSNILWSDSYYIKLSSEAKLNAVINATRERIVDESMTAAQDIHAYNVKSNEEALMREPSISLYL